MTLQTQQFFLLTPDGPAHGRLREAEGYFLAGNLNEALAAAQQAWRESPREPDVFRVLAYLHMARGEYPPAEQAAKQALLLEENNPYSHAMLAQVYLTFDIRYAADDLLTRAVARFPSELALTSLLADLSFRQRQFLRAVDMANRVLAANPGDGYMHALLGQYDLKQKRYAAAITHLRAAVEAFPQRADYQQGLGIALLHEGDPVNGIRALAASLGMQPTDLKTQRYLFLAAKALPEWGWPARLTLTFFENSGLGWLLNILGWSMGFVGLVWLLVVASSFATSMQGPVIAFGLLVVGVALILMTTGGLLLAGRKGERFETKLHALLEQHGIATARHL